MKIDLRNASPGYRLSPQQQAQWPGDGTRRAYVVTLTLDGRLDSHRLLDAANAVARRYEILRTVVRPLPDGAGAIQMVGAHEPATTLPARLPSDDAPFGVALRDDAAGCVIDVSIDGSCADRWSVATILERLADAYRDARLPDARPVIEYPDLSEGYHTLLLDPAGRRYWNQRLASTRAATHDAAPPAPASEVAHSTTLACDAGLTETECFARWVLFLTKWTRSRAVIAGYLAPGNRFAEHADLVGPIARPLALPFEVDWSSDVDSILRAIARQIDADLAQADHFDCTAPGPVAGPAFMFEPSCALPAVFAGLRVLDATLRTPPSSAVLQLSMIAPGVLRLSARDLPHARFETMIAQVRGVFDPAAPIGGMRPGAVAPRGNDAALDQAHDMPCVADTVRHWARHRPEHIALRDATQSMSYAALDVAVRDAARTLAARGVSHRDTVALQTRRGVEWVVWWLAIWRTGAVVLPLPADASAERTAQGCAQAGARWLVSTTTPADHTAGLPPVITPTAERACVEATAPDHRPAANEPAYILFTSGSTGTPKAVTVSHHALSTYLGWARTRYASERHGGTIVHSELTFDFTQTCLWLPLLAGETVRFAPDPVTPAMLYDLLLCEPPLSFIKLTPAHLQGFAALETLNPRAVPWPDHVVVGGAALAGAMLPPSLRRARAIIHNEYGPTEATVGCCVQSEPAEGISPGSVSIGAATPRSALLVLDAELQPAPAGEAGELYLSGDQLALGYVGNPAETAQRFLPNPAPGSPGERVYRTGDLVRRTPDDHLVFVGRVDDMIKRNGVRIEPGAITAHVLRHPGVSGCHTFAQRPAPASEPLVVCAVVGDGVDVHALRAWLASQLPAHTMPNRIVPVDTLPCTPQGKIDERALAASLSVAAPAPPSLATRAETVLGAIWRATLGATEITPSSHFFVEGGDSIRAITVAVEARKQGLLLTAEHLFQHPVLRDLAAAATAAGPVPDDAAPTMPDARPPDADVEETCPASYLQLGMIFQNQAHGHDGRYHDIFSYRLGLHVDEACLREAARRAVARHPALRTTFDLAADGQAVQRIWTRGPDVLDYEDLTALSPADQQRTIDQWIAGERARGFDVRVLPLLRFKAHRLGPRTLQFTTSFHHGIMDGWSDQQIHTELFADYQALLRGREARLAPPVSRYRDFVAAERAAVESPVTRGFWRDYLEDAASTRLSPASEDPPACAEPDAPTHHHRTGTVSAPVCQRLHDAARQSREPLAVLLLSAHLVALRLLTGERELLSCSVTDCRLDEDTGERAVGLYINTLPVRARVDDDTWRALVNRVGHDRRAAFGHRRLPYAEICRLAGEARLSDSLFYFTNFHNGIAATDDLVQYGKSSHEVTSFPLTASFNVAPSTGEMTYSLAFDTRHFTAARIEQIARCYDAALDALARGIDAPLPTIDAMPDVSRSILLNDDASSASAPNLPALFAAQVRSHGDAPAVRDAHGVLTYRELDARARSVAAALARRGMGAGSVVGIRIAYSAALPVALLGVLMSGACFVAVDPDEPHARLAHVLANVALVLCPNGDDAPASAVPHLDLHALETEGAGAQTFEPPPIAPLLPAYRIYTSGTTGIPKCVDVHHAAYVNAIAHFRDMLRVGPGDRVMLTSALTFDISLLEVALPLASGAVLHVLNRDEALTPAAYDTTGHAAGHTIIQATPSVWSVLRLRGWSCPPRVTALVGGEALPRELGDWLSDATEAAWQVYGPSETTIWSTAARLGHASHTIGAPIAQTRCYLLDERLDAVPSGSVGTLYIGGAGVALGYAGATGATAASFLPDPHAATPGARMYRTGDRAHVDETGALVFLGRVDRQVKLAGHRLELDEVEARLAAHPDIAHAIVVLHPESQDRLAAYLVARTPRAQPDAAQLRDWLSTHVPPYALPASYTWIDTPPRTRNGKLDRRALPVPARAHAASAARQAAPSRPLERVLQHLWMKVLTVESIGVHDNFMTLGGYSLSAIRIVAQLRDLFGVPVSASALFTAPTICELADHLLDTYPSADIDAKSDLLLSLI
ncbi:non-ribosomal peptide synthetase [Burkholderia humptydooensis]|uniref:Non-ribosomal peptide synthetase n=3 Tax=Burkholderiaceae TaxID=119060 RepID=A0A7U4SUW1_9BURK|nr:amino acid adenylation domain protein [Burkholderia sp. 2002721687]ALX46296.1 non-ribosomal peptide synthetase [Burkholderia humptydooensis]EIP84680.1 amino acid adenylation domain protein [Burkholderia humptydooensis MSMB43]QPS47801.1 non-ribosomal peptide synthetase [Burkholderia humptydooensis]